jgi:hypothetical protein
MAPRQPRYGAEEHARLGNETYERQVRPQVEAGNLGRIAAIDIDTADLEVAENSLAACQRLLTRRPDAQIWCVRIGSPAVHHVGLRGGVGRRQRSASVKPESRMIPFCVPGGRSRLP